MARAVARAAARAPASAFERRLLGGGPGGDEGGDGGKGPGGADICCGQPRSTPLNSDLVSPEITIKFMILPGHGGCILGYFRLLIDSGAKVSLLGPDMAGSSSPRREHAPLRPE